MKLVGLIIVLALLLTGCGTLAPINTKLELEGENFPSVMYKSEKDVLYERTTLPDGTEEVKLQAVASAPAMAQAERDKAEAEARVAQTELLTQLIQNFLNSPVAPNVIRPPD
jgi:hypothetical protein